MKIYQDCDRNTLVTEQELKENFAELRTVDSDYLQINFEQFVNNCLLANGGCLVELADINSDSLTNYYENVIYNLITMLNEYYDENIADDYFVEYITDNAGLNDKIYDYILEI